MIEDLNEDGLSDLKHPGVQDLPLILSRIELVKQLAPNAMDQVNADAFAEAYKDLVNLSNGQSAQLSQSELDALRQRLIECWNPPAGVVNATRLQVVLRVLFNQDGTVARPPDLVAATPSPLGPPMAESAKRAILRCQPFNMLKPEHYEQWKDIEITFDPRDMTRG